MGNGSLFLADLKLAGVLFSVEFDFCSTANCPSVFDAQANYLNQKLLTVDVEPKHIRTKTYMRKLVIEEILQSDWQSSIIIIGGANMIGWPEKMIDDELEIVRNAGVVQLQREIPYSINIQVAKAMKRAVVQISQAVVKCRVIVLSSVLVMVALVMHNVLWLCQEELLMSLTCSGIKKTFLCHGLVKKLVVCVL
ncbi:hypothetical protein F2Q69_00047976 [Brassica cretica]|uniref:Uncharacterized protein n=1 Tax=Brassica cretica TaxID=69181 RepID=A0A8S9PI18_BRACR|nr:hypothetical protein F2Q69_00047976 [Brassica cretica]